MSEKRSHTRYHSLLHSQRLFTQSTLIKHVIGFIQYEDLYFRRLYDLSPQEISHSARGADYNMRRYPCDALWEIVFDSIFCLYGGELSHRHHD